MRAYQRIWEEKAGVMLATYEGTNVDWGTITGAALREGLQGESMGMGTISYVLDIAN